MTDAPYPADTRAKGWRFELDHERIRQSDTWALTPAEYRPWLLMLWMVAWEQTPCGSMPDDDELICARIGMASKAFSKAKASLMRGWWKATDGRLYHKVITERVLEMMDCRRKEAERKRGYRGRSGESHGSPEDVPRDTTVSDDTGTGTYSFSKEKGADAPDPIWETGLAYLVSCNVPEKGARSFLGKMRQSLQNDLLVAELLLKAQQEKVGDPVPWLRAAAGRRINTGRTKAGVAL